MDPHRRAEERSRVLHGRIAERLREDPRLLELARQHVEDWSKAGKLDERYAAQWRALLGSTFAVAADGSLWAWGSNFRGKLGDGTAIDRHLPVQVGADFALVASGPYHMLAIKTDGALWAWGANSAGQVEDDTTSERGSPVFVGNGFMAAAAGEAFSLAVKTDGTLWSWGDNLWGALGDGTSGSKATPTLVP